MATSKLRDAIQAALEGESYLDVRGRPLRVDLEDDVIRLSGIVADIATKRRAVRQARAAAKTARIVDTLQVATSRERPDAELCEALAQQLMREPVFRDVQITEGREGRPHAEGIQVSARAGTARLDGVLRSLTHRRLAEVLAWWTPGVGDVDNRIHVEPAETDSDDELADAVRMVLEMEPALEADRMQVVVRDRVVRLQGAVANEELRQIALADCWYVAGVHDVEDALDLG